MTRLAIMPGLMLTHFRWWILTIIVCVRLDDRRRILINGVLWVLRFHYFGSVDVVGETGRCGQFHVVWAWSQDSLWLVWELRCGLPERPVNHVFVSWRWLNFGCWEKIELRYGRFGSQLLPRLHPRLIVKKLFGTYGYIHLACIRILTKHWWHPGSQISRRTFDLLLLILNNHISQIQVDFWRFSFTNRNMLPRGCFDLDILGGLVKCLDGGLLGSLLALYATFEHLLGKVEGVMIWSWCQLAVVCGFNSYCLEFRVGHIFCAR